MLDLGCRYSNNATRLLFSSTPLVNTFKLLSARENILHILFVFFATLVCICSCIFVFVFYYCELREIFTTKIITNSLTKICWHISFSIKKLYAVKHINFDQTNKSVSATTKNVVALSEKWSANIVISLGIVYF